MRANKHASFFLDGSNKRLQLRPCNCKRPSKEAAKICRIITVEAFTASGEVVGVVQVNHRYKTRNGAVPQWLLLLVEEEGSNPIPLAVRWNSYTKNPDDCLCIVPKIRKGRVEKTVDFMV